MLLTNVSNKQCRIANANYAPFLCLAFSASRPSRWQKIVWTAVLFRCENEPSQSVWFGFGDYGS